MRSLSAALLVVFTFGLAACARHAYGPDGLALFPPGSSSRSFFEKCNFVEMEGGGSWFCDMSHDYKVVERAKPNTHDEEIQAFVARESVRLGKYAGKQSTKLEGKLAGLEFSTLGFELQQDDPKHPETKGLAPFPWVVFFGTETLPDGAGLVVSCTIAGSSAGDVAKVAACHEGMKILRETMHAKHKK